VSTRSACVNMKAPPVDAQGNTSCAYSPARRRTPLSSCDATATQSNPKTECPVGPKFGMHRPDRACQSNSRSFGRPQNSLLWGAREVLHAALCRHWSAPEKKGAWCPALAQSRERGFSCTNSARVSSRKLEVSEAARSSLLRPGWPLRIEESDSQLVVRYTIETAFRVASTILSRKLAEELASHSGMFAHSGREPH
jgi:hypothetical protein